MGYDLVLSSGFLAFARHTGFLAAVEEVDLPVDAVCGTSSGALVGALWVAGVPAAEILSLLASRRPIAWAAPHRAPWQGALRLDRVIDELSRHVPSRFSQLSRPFGAGVVGPEGHRVVTAGPLPEAVAASCAVPWLFAPVLLDGVGHWDGGAADRLGLAPWRVVRPGAHPVVHRVDRSAGASREVALDGVPTVRSQRAGASLWSLGDVQAAHDATRRDAVRVLRRLADSPAGAWP